MKYVHYSFLKLKLMFSLHICKCYANVLQHNVSNNQMRVNHTHFDSVTYAGHLCTAILF